MLVAVEVLLDALEVAMQEAVSPSVMVINFSFSKDLNDLSINILILEQPPDVVESEHSRIKQVSGLDKVDDIGFRSLRKNSGEALQILVHSLSIDLNRRFLSSGNNLSILGDASRMHGVLTSFREVEEELDKSCLS